MAIPCQGSWQLCSLPIKHFRAPSLCCIKCTITTLCVVHSVVQSYTIPNIELKFKGSILFKLPLMCSVDQLNTILNKKYLTPGTLLCLEYLHQTHLTLKHTLNILLRPLNTVKYSRHRLKHIKTQVNYKINYPLLKKINHKNPQYIQKYALHILQYKYSTYITTVHYYWVQIKQQNQYKVQ